MGEGCVRRGEERGMGRLLAGMTWDSWEGVRCGGEEGGWRIRFIRSFSKDSL